MERPPNADADHRSASPSSFHVHKYGETPRSSSVRSRYLQGDEARRVTGEGGRNTYLVERYWPGVTEAALAAALERATAGASDQRVRHVHSVLIPGEEVVFSVFEAASAADVESANRLAEAPFERVVEAMPVGLSLDPSGRSGG